MNQPAQNTTVSPAERLVMITSLLGIFTAFALLVGSIIYVSSHGSAAHAEIRAASAAGNHAEAVQIYENPVVVRFGPDRHLSEAAGRRNLWHGNTVPSSSSHLALGNSYAAIGQPETAEQHYLYAIGWDRTQYNSYCQLFDDCQNDASLARMARHAATDQKAD